MTRTTSKPRIASSWMPSVRRASVRIRFDGPSPRTVGHRPVAARSPTTTRVTATWMSSASPRTTLEAVSGRDGRASNLCTAPPSTNCARPSMLRSRISSPRQQHHAHRVVEAARMHGAGTCSRISLPIRTSWGSFGSTTSQRRTGKCGSTHHSPRGGATAWRWAQPPTSGLSRRGSRLVRSPLAHRQARVTTL